MPDGVYAIKLELSGAGGDGGCAQHGNPPGCSDTGGAGGGGGNGAGGGQGNNDTASTRGGGGGLALPVTNDTSIEISAGTAASGGRVVEGGTQQYGVPGGNGFVKVYW